MGFLSEIMRSWRKSRERRQLERVLGSTKPFDDVLSGRSSGFESLQSAAEGGRRRRAALEELVSLCERDPSVAAVMRDFGATREDLKELYEKLIEIGGGQWVKGHFVAASALAYAPTLAYCLKARTEGQPDMAMVAGTLLEHFRGSDLIETRKLIEEEEKGAKHEDLFEGGSQESVPRTGRRRTAVSIEDRLARVERELAAEKRRNRLLDGLGVAGVVVALAWTLAQTLGGVPSRGQILNIARMTADNDMFERASRGIHASASEVDVDASARALALTTVIESDMDALMRLRKETPLTPPNAFALSRSLERDMRALGLGHRGGVLSRSLERDRRRKAPSELSVEDQIRALGLMCYWLDMWSAFDVPTQKRQIGWIENLGKMRPREMIPFIGVVVRRGRLNLVREAMERLGASEGTESSLERDRLLVAHFFKEIAEEAARGKTSTAKVTGMIAQMVPYALLFYFMFVFAKGNPEQAESADDARPPSG